MTTRRDDLISPPEQPIQVGVEMRLGTAGPDALAYFTPPVAPEVILTEEEMQRLIVDGMAGKRRLPTDLRAAKIAKRLWAELDAMPPNAVVELPQSIPDVGGIL